VGVGGGGGGGGGGAQHSLVGTTPLFEEVQSAACKQRMASPLGD